MAKKQAQSKSVCSACGEKLQKVYWEFMLEIGVYKRLCNKCGLEFKNALQPKSLDK